MEKHMALKSRMARKEPTTISRRNVIAVLAGAPALLLPRKSSAQESTPEIEKGPFNGTREALQAYQVPEWFRDAKFGANFSSIATDAKGVIQIFNVGAERMLGYTASEV